jgi:NADPH:quinone reductase-like Zn-dependent oxidoreductase
MKAIVYSHYGSPEVLRCEEIEKPTPGDNEVLLRVRAAAVNPFDWHVMRGMPYFLRMMAGLRQPKETRLGVDVAGQVEAAGKNVTSFKAGDEVFGSCRGALAEYARASESTLVTKPDSVTFEQAAAAPLAAWTALQGLRDEGQIRSGQKVLINGAAGGVGTFAVQIARSFGADVTAVCGTRNVDMVRSIGADRVIDYTREDFTKSGERYDLVLDTVGNHSLLACRRVLIPQGRYVAVGGPSGRWMIGFLVRVIAAPVLSRFVSQKLSIVMARPSQEDLVTVRDLMETGRVTPVIDRRYELSEVPEAIRYLEEGHARGKVVITFGI